MKKHFLQSGFWQRAKNQLGQEVVSQKDVNIFIKKTLFGKVGYIPRVNIEDIKDLELCELGCVYVRIDPNDKKQRVTGDGQREEKNKFLPAGRHGETRNSSLPAGTAKPGTPIQLPKTVIINLTKSEEDLKAQMKQKHRYNLKLAEKKGVKITISDSNEDLDVFLKLYLDTAKRQNYFARGEQYIRTIWKEAKKENACFIATGWYEGKPIVSWMLLVYENSVTYPYGGTSESHRNVMGTYKLAWEIMLWAKNRGLHYFDLYGIEEDASDGFTRFKLGFVEKDKSQIIEYAGTLDIVIKPIRYRIIRTFEAFRNTFTFLKNFS